MYHVFLSERFWIHSFGCAVAEWLIIIIIIMRMRSIKFPAVVQMVASHISLSFWTGLNLNVWNHWTRFPSKHRARSSGEWVQWWMEGVSEVIMVQNKVCNQLRNWKWRLSIGAWEFVQVQSAMRGRGAQSCCKRMEWEWEGNKMMRVDNPLHYFGRLRIQNSNAIHPQGTLYCAGIRLEVEEGGDLRPKHFQSHGKE